MFKLLIITRSEGTVAQSVATFEMKNLAEEAICQIRKFDEGLPDWTVKVIPLYEYAEGRR